MKNFTELQEGVYDPNIFKAIFLAGGPGSGKSYVVRKTTGGLGMKIVNSDDIYEKMLKDAGLETTPEDIYSDEGQAIRIKAKKTTLLRSRDIIILHVQVYVGKISSFLPNYICSTFMLCSVARL